MTERIVIDTNVFVSFLLRPRSTPAQAVKKAWSAGPSLVSNDTWSELRIVLARPRLSVYIPPNIVEQFFDNLRAISEFVAIPTPIRACRDPRDDKFLEVAFHGRADMIVTGDQDLLALHPFQGIAILTPAAFLDLPAE